MKALLFAIQQKGNRKSTFEVDFEKKSADNKNMGKNFPGWGGGGGGGGGEMLIH